MSHFGMFDSAPELKLNRAGNPIVSVTLDAEDEDTRETFEKIAASIAAGRDTSLTVEVSLHQIVDLFIEQRRMAESGAGVVLPASDMPTIKALKATIASLADKLDHVGFQLKSGAVAKRLLTPGEEGELFWIPSHVGIDWRENLKAMLKNLQAMGYVADGAPSLEDIQEIQISGDEVRSSDVCSGENLLEFEQYSSMWPLTKSTEAQFLPAAKEMMRPLLKVLEIPEEVLEKADVITFSEDYVRLEAYPHNTSFGDKLSKAWIDFDETRFSFLNVPRNTPHYALLSLSSQALTVPGAAAVKEMIRASGGNANACASLSEILHQWQKTLASVNLDVQLFRIHCEEPDEMSVVPVLAEGSAFIGALLIKFDADGNILDFDLATHANEVMSQEFFDLYSESEADLNDGAGFWSRDNEGWVGQYDSVGYYALRDAWTIPMPPSAGRDAKFVPAGLLHDGVPGKSWNN